MRKRITSGSAFEAQYAYSRVLIDGNDVFVAGTTGYDYRTMRISDDVVEQAQQCFENISSALSEAGSDLSEVVRVRYLLPDGSDFARCQPVIAKYMAEARPAATMMVVGLLDQKMKIEIEVTARRVTEEA